MSCQLPLFLQQNIQPLPHHIPGLQYRPEYISAAQEKSLLQHIDTSPWCTQLKRRVQHYGYRYDYQARHIDANQHLGALPAWLQPLAQQLVADGFFTGAPDQVIVNEYLPGQGIAPHIDCTPCFKAVICSISLGGFCQMQLTNPKTNEQQQIDLHPRSALVLAGDARYVWQHGIAARKNDMVNGIKTPRQRRVSLTFRQVIL